MRLFVDGVLGKKGFDGIPAARQQQMRENLGALKAQMLGAGFPPLHEQNRDQARCAQIDPEN